MPDPTRRSSAGRRSLAASWGSLALHGGAIALAMWIVRARPPRPPRRPVVSDIEVVDAVRAAAPAVPRQVAPPSPIAGPRAAVEVHRVRELPPPAPARAAPVAQRLVDVRISYDEPRHATARAATASPGEHMLRTAAVSAGVDLPAQDGLATLAMPGAAPASLARPPRAKHDYHNLPMHADRQFDGQTIRVLISIDDRGKVRRVDLLRGVEAHLDASTIALVHQFEFEPALDDAGAPIPGYAKWDIVIGDESQEASRDNPRKGYY